MSRYENFFKNQVYLAKFYKQPLSEIDALTLEDFDLMCEWMEQEAKDQKQASNAPKNGKFRKLT